jgi:predicted kinase
MRAFDRREELDRLVRDRRISAAELEDFGRRLARLHADLPRLPSGRAAGQPAAVAAALTRNASECASFSAVFGTEARISALSAALAREAEVCTAAVAWRAQAGAVRECHADLHLSNVVRINGQLLPFDCLEFEPAFRWIDVAQDIAFFYADMRGYGEPRLADAFLNAYLAESGDYHACAVLSLYVADRALVRAKVIGRLASSAKDRGGDEMELLSRRHLAYLHVAERSLRATTPACIMMTGLPGSGKSWLAAQLAPALEAIHLRSDIERKRLAGMSATERSHSPLEGGLYTGARTDAVYQRLERCAAEVLAGHRTVIVDANYGKRQQRAALAGLCTRLSVPLYVVECAAPAPLLRQRIATRASVANDASEADLSVLEAQLAQWQPIAGDEQLTVIAANTASTDVEVKVLGALQAQLRAG